MVVEIFAMFATAFNAVIGWFDQLMQGDLWTLVFSVISMFLIARFIILPIFGGSLFSNASDKASNNKNNQKNNNGFKSKGSK